jgi:ribosome-associated protein
MSPNDLNRLIVRILDEKKAGEITVLDIADKTIIADFFVIATGRSTTQVKALAGALEDKLAEFEILPARKEGLSEGRWVVLDYCSIIVHIFNDETRDYYCLEKLWAGKP